MLPPITQKYHDQSTDAYFQFAFYCEACGDAWHSEQYPFSLAKDPPKSAAEEKARAILWTTEHDAAYERANTEAIMHFSKCRCCGKRICDRCLSELDDMCTECAGKS